MNVDTLHYLQINNVDGRSLVIEAAKTSMPGLNVESTGEPPGGITQPMDLSASKAHLGWAPQFSLADGLADYASELKARLGL